ncbi:MAG: ferritin-like domain-containing protein [Burkholderiaceae bacterium]
MNDQVKELLYQMLETEIGGVQVYTTALDCVVNDDLREEWTKYLQQTERHVEVVRQLLQTLGLNPDTQTSGRQVVRHIGESLVKAMQIALEGGGKPEAAELVACECVVFAETKDHTNWELLSKYVQKTAQGKEREVLAAAVAEVEDQEDEHIYHSKGWCRELWIKSLGMPAVLPPPEEERKVKTALGAAHAEKAREEML